MKRTLLLLGTLCLLGAVAVLTTLPLPVEPALMAQNPVPAPPIPYAG